jgi:hypothetical protein
LGLWAVSIFTSFGFGMAAMAVAGALIGESKKGTAAVIFIAFLVATTTGIVATATCETALWVVKVSGISVDQAPDHPWATVFYFRDAGVREDLSETAVILGSSGKGGSHPIDTAFVAPVVSKDWTPDQAVKVWTVAQEETFKERSQNWKQSGGAAVRILGLYISDYEHAANWAKERFGLKSIADPVFIDWTPDPEGAIITSWLQLGKIAGIGLLIFLAVILVGRALPAEDPKRH